MGDEITSNKAFSMRTLVTRPDRIIGAAEDQRGVMACTMQDGDDVFIVITAMDGDGGNLSMIFDMDRFEIFASMMEKVAEECSLLSAPAGTRQ